MRPPPTSDQCATPHDLTSTALTSIILVGLVASYVPQLARIVNKGTSEGFSPWYLLLGATSSASGMLNVLVVQWPLFRCCRVISAGRCFESLMGFLQVSFQWLLFSCILVLYLVYFPAHLKYHRSLPLTGSPRPTYGALPDSSDSEDEANTLHESFHGTTRPVRARVGTTPEWRQAVTVAVVVLLHVSLLFLIALALLLYLPPTTPPHPLIKLLATFLGLSGTVLAIAQYAPQIHRTYTSRLVGALSIGTMCIQVPGSVLFILSLASRPGVDWISCLPYAVTAGMQGVLLVLCLMWKRRQKREGVDDFGNKLDESTGASHGEGRSLLSR